MTQQLNIVFQFFTSQDVHSAINSENANVVIVDGKTVSIWRRNRVALKFDVYYPNGENYFRIGLTLFNPCLETLTQDLTEYPTLGTALAYIYGLIGKEPKVSLDSFLTVNNFDLKHFPVWIGDFYSQLILGRSTFDCKITRFDRAMRSGRYADTVHAQ